MNHQKSWQEKWVQCESTRKDGNRCEAPAVKGETRCQAHYRWYMRRLPVVDMGRLKAKLIESEERGKGRWISAGEVSALLRLM